MRPTIVMPARVATTLDSRARVTSEVAGLLSPPCVGFLRMKMSRTGRDIEWTIDLYADAAASCSQAQLLGRVKRQGLEGMDPVLRQDLLERLGHAGVSLLTIVPVVAF